MEYVILFWICTLMIGWFNVKIYDDPKKYLDPSNQLILTRYEYIYCFCEYFMVSSFILMFVMLMNVFHG